MPENSSKFNPNDLEAVHKEAIETHALDIAAIEPNHREARDDIRFLEGGERQWRENDLRDRKARGAVCLTNSPLNVLLGRAIGSALLNRPSIKTIPVDGEADPKTAETTDGIISNIEYQSNAPAVYKHVMKAQYGHGFGYAELTTDYTGIETFEQDIKINRIKNSFSVIPDRNSQDPTLADSNSCFIEEWTTRKQFKADFPDETPTSFDRAATAYPLYFSRWFKQDEVLLAKWYKRVEKKVKVVLLSDGRVVRKDVLQDDPDLLDEVVDLTVENEREAISHEVYEYLLSGDKVLDGPTKIMANMIPVACAAGRTLEVGDYTLLRGLINASKDAVMMANYWLSEMAESLTTMAKAPWTGTAKMFEGYEEFWRTSSRVNYAYLPWKVDPQAPNLQPQRQPPPFMPDAAFVQYQLMNDDIKNTVGLQDASLGIRSNETSGLAINARDRQADVQMFEFVDNFNDFLGQIGRIMLQMIPNVYDTRRVIRILNPDGTTTEAILNNKFRDPNDPFTILTDNDLAAGKYDIRIEEGPSFTTKRQETARQLLEIFQFLNPVQQAAIAPTLVNSLDVVGKDEMVSILKKTAPPGILEPEEGEEPPGPLPPTPEQQIEAGKLQLEAQKLQNEAAQIQVDMAKTQVDAAKVAQEAQDTNENIDDRARTIALDTIEQVVGA